MRKALACREGSSELPKAWPVTAAALKNEIGSYVPLCRRHRQCCHDDDNHESNTVAGKPATKTHRGGSKSANQLPPWWWRFRHAPPVVDAPPSVSSV